MGPWSLDDFGWDNAKIDGQSSCRLVSPPVAAAAGVAVKTRTTAINKAVMILLAEKEIWRTCSDRFMTDTFYLMRSLRLGGHTLILQIRSRSIL
jgi:hypothetical protein